MHHAWGNSLLWRLTTKRRPYYETAREVHHVENDLIMSHLILNTFQFWVWLLNSELEIKTKSILVWKSKFKKLETFLRYFQQCVACSNSHMKGSFYANWLDMNVHFFHSFSSIFQSWIQNSVHMFSLLHLCTSFHT